MPVCCEALQIYTSSKSVQKRWIQQQQGKGDPEPQQGVIIPARCSPFICWIKRQVWGRCEHQLSTEWVRKSSPISGMSALILKARLSFHLLRDYLKSQSVTFLSCRNISAFGALNSFLIPIEIQKLQRGCAVHLGTCSSSSHFGAVWTASHRERCWHFNVLFYILNVHL